MQLSSEIQGCLRLDELLNKHASSTDHGQATFVEFLGLDHPELFLALWLEAEGVEAEVPQAVVLACPLLVMAVDPQLAPGADTCWLYAL